MSIIGKKYNMLTILDSQKKNKKYYYLCRCECGNEKWIRTDAVTSGNTKSCGCLYKKINFEDDIGKKYNKWTVLRQEIRDHKRYYYCKCDCGNEEWRQATSIRTNKSKECSFCLRNKGNG